MAKRLLYRGNLRDVVIVLAAISSIYYPINTVQIAVALVLLAAGTLLHVVTKATLIRNEVLCREGVYRICRHPYYLSNFTVDVSLCLLSGNIYLVLAYPFLFFWAYGPNLRSEENRLADIHKQDQYDFLLQVPQIFPGPGSIVWPGQILKETSLRRISMNECSRIIKFWGFALGLILIHHVAAADRRLAILYKEPIDTLAAVLAGATGALCLLGFVLQVFSRERENEGRKEKGM